MGTAKARQGMWDGAKWLFLRGARRLCRASGEGWQVLSWHSGEELSGHLVLRAEALPDAVPLLLQRRPLLAWRRAEAVRSSQDQALALQLSRLDAVFDPARNLGEEETRRDLVRLMANRSSVVPSSWGCWWWTRRGRCSTPRVLGCSEALDGEQLHEVVQARSLVHAIELVDQTHSHGFAFVAEPAVGRLCEDDLVFLRPLLNLTSSQLSSLELRAARSRLSAWRRTSTWRQRPAPPAAKTLPGAGRLAMCGGPLTSRGRQPLRPWMARDED